MRHNVISVITCTIDPEKYRRFESMLPHAFSREPYEIVKIPDAKSLCEGYTRGAERAKGDLLVFCHDDITFLNRNLDDLLYENLAIHDIVGVAGTTHLREGSWAASGFPYLHGQIAHAKPGMPEHTLHLYGCGRDPIQVPGIQALDGVFFALKRKTMDQLKFDAKIFDGFHLYDLDFTYGAFLKGKKLVVDHRIHILHFSGGSYDKNWKRYRYFFNRKYRSWLRPPRDIPLAYYKNWVYAPDDREALVAQMRINADEPKLRAGHLFLEFDRLLDDLPIGAVNTGAEKAAVEKLARAVAGCQSGATLFFRGPDHALAGLASFSVNAGTHFLQHHQNRIPGALLIHAAVEHPETRVLAEVLKTNEAIKTALKRFIPEVNGG